MPRISISLTEGLMKRMEPVKDKINISQVCREALEGRVATFERANGRHGGKLDVQRLIGRLREERALVEGKWERLAVRNASIWLDTASYEELRGVAEDRGSLNMDKYRLPHGAFRMMKQDLKEAKVGFEGTHVVVYKTAWLDRVRAVWNQIRGKLGDRGHNRRPARRVHGVRSQSAP